MGKDKEPLGSEKGRGLNAEVARICLALHRARPFTHLAATDGGRDMPNKWVGDRFVPRPVVSYGVYEGPARFGRPVEGSGQLEGGDDELRLAFGQGLWGGRLPDDWQVIDAEMYAVLAYLRKMATAEDAADRRCLVLSDCKPALQQIEAAYRKGSLEGLREMGRSVRGDMQISRSARIRHVPVGTEPRGVR